MYEYVSYNMISSMYFRVFSLIKYSYTIKRYLNCVLTKFHTFWWQGMEIPKHMYSFLLDFAISIENLLNDYRLTFSSFPRPLSIFSVGIGIIRVRDGQNPIFSARPVVHFSGPARNKNFYFRPVWARENF